MSALLAPVAFLVVAGFAAISSISFHLFLLQLLWAALGIVLVLLLWFVDWRTILGYRWVAFGLYGLTILLLLVTSLWGPVIRNTRGWLVLGPFTLQPVELAKVALILLYAHYFSRAHLGIARWRHIVTSFVLFAIPTGIVALQPDLGSALVLFAIWFGFLLVSGLPPRRVILALVIFLLAGVAMWHGVLKDYQRERILGVAYPERNALGINYSVIQSKIAIGSAGWWGKGYKQGSQTQLGFLTEPANDFVFAALVEEWGLLAGLLVIAAFLALVYRILRIGAIAEQNFEKFVCLGTAVAFGMQFLLNAGSATGLTPVIGVTFPFVSYGGSSMLANFFLVAIINAIRKRI